jgi:hypothetical protein
MSLERSKKADLPPLILSDMLFPNSIPLQSVGAIPVQAGLRPSLAADQRSATPSQNKAEKFTCKVGLLQELSCLPASHLFW